MTMLLTSLKKKKIMRSDGRSESLKHEVCTEIMMKQQGKHGKFRVLIMWYGDFIGDTDRSVSKFWSPLYKKDMELLERIQ